MHVTYLAITILAALANGYAATLNFVGAESVKVVADRVQVSRAWMVPLGTLLAAGAGAFSQGSPCRRSAQPRRSASSCTSSAPSPPTYESATTVSAEPCSSCSWQWRP